MSLLLAFLAPFVGALIGRLYGPRALRWLARKLRRRRRPPISDGPIAGRPIFIDEMNQTVWMHRSIVRSTGITPERLHRVIFGRPK